ncbi:hypothetical protein ABZ636_40520 [Streptomyces sp. NPDC007251]|uniref:hypothetical protein n=1 Tax=Streptomyces sp. NPDC007251 TaxID=3154483 RepID=UPI0033D357C2
MKASKFALPAMSSAMIRSVGVDVRPFRQRTITWVKKAENDSRGATITNWRRAFHVMDHDPFYVIV